MQSYEKEKNDESQGYPWFLLSLYEIQKRYNDFIIPLKNGKEGEMKSKIQSFFMKFISLFLCLSTLLGNSCLPTYAADTYQYISSFKTYGKDTFPEEYAYGVVDLASATKITKGSGVTTTTNVGTGNVENFIGYCGNNTSFSDAYSVTYTKGARYKNEYYDVKIRFRTTDSKYYWMNLVPKR